jgi:hypothetical protein
LATRLDSRNIVSGCKPQCASMRFATTCRANGRVVVWCPGSGRLRVRVAYGLKLHHRFTRVRCHAGLAGLMCYAGFAWCTCDRVREQARRRAGRRARNAARARNWSRARDRRDCDSLADGRRVHRTALRDGGGLNLRAFRRFLRFSNLDSDMLEEHTRVCIARVDGKRVFCITPCASP